MKKLTRQQIINIINSNINLYENECKHWVGKDENFANLMCERAYTLKLLLEDIQFSEED